MVRLADLSDFERNHLLERAGQAPRFDSDPWAPGPPLNRRRVALVSTAGLHRREDRPFDGSAGATEYRVIPQHARVADLLMSHVSVNFDRSGYRADANVVFPLERLRELAGDGTIGAVADFHYSFMGAVWPPTRLEQTARELALLLKRDCVDAAVLLPV